MSHKGDSPVSHGGEFRPERGVVVLHIALGAVIAGFGIAFAAATWIHGSFWPLAVLAGGLLLGLWIGIRAPAMRVSYDADSLYVIGLIRSHRISRDDVIAIDPDGLRRPCVRWAPAGSTDRWTLLSPVSLPYAFLPAAMHARRLRFIARLLVWARDAEPAHADPGLQSRMREFVERVEQAVTRSPTIMVLVAIVSLGLLVMSYLDGR